MVRRLRKKADIYALMWLIIFAAMLILVIIPFFGKVYDRLFGIGGTKAMNSFNEMYGDERLEEILKNTSNSNSKKIVDSTITSLKEFRGSKEPNDDITIVVLKIV